MLTPPADRYRVVRRFTTSLCESLEPEDCVIQSMPDVSPTRWHLAHTTWFFETFLLRRWMPGYRPAHEAFEYLFNSYYNTIGDQFPRARRGLLSRPTVSEVLAYRRSVDDAMFELLSGAEKNLAAGDDTHAELSRVLDIGLNHEQQHQELMLTDIKHVFWCNPLFPAFRPDASGGSSSGTGPVEAAPIHWIEYAEGLNEIGHAGDAFAFDNELPRHRTFVPRRRLASRLVTNGEYAQFIADGGYRESRWWLSAGWDTVQSEGWRAPLYWVDDPAGWHEFTLSGLRKLATDEPVCHVSYFEADAFARWSGARLPTEAEWEIAAAPLAAASSPIAGNFVESGALHPCRCTPVHLPNPPAQLFGDVWEWTSSSYEAYPGYRAPDGALGEYNGKFMCNQYVLRGGSCATSKSHIRATYRNFFPAPTRWQFAGIRLARS